MKKTFVELLKESFKKVKTKSGSIINGTILSINKDTVLIDSCLKSESKIPLEQFHNLYGKLEIKIGDQIDLVLDTIENGFGETLLSRDKAKYYESWLLLEKALKNHTIIKGMITGKVKGGFNVELCGIRAFLPGSLIDVRPIRDSLNLENKEFDFKVVKLDKKNNNVIVSRRAILESENNNKRNFLLENLKENKKFIGIVKNLTDYGAFIDLGGIDGLLHIIDMTWKRIKHPNKILNIGDEIKVIVLNFDHNRVRVSLGLKQLSKNPWIDLMHRYPKGKRLKGHITNITDYGCFVEIENGIEGLVHTSEMDWSNKNKHPTNMVHIGDKVNVIILDIDKDKHRISLGIKQCKSNPWKYFFSLYKKGDYIKGIVKSVNDFGIFLKLEGGIDGLIHYSDISWVKNEKTNILKYEKNNEILVIILQIDIERERISLGIKQLIENIFNKYIEFNKRGRIVIGRIYLITKKIIKIKLKKNIYGNLLISNIRVIKKINTNFIYKIGMIIKVKFTSINYKKKIINLSCV